MPPISYFPYPNKNSLKTQTYYHRMMDFEIQSGIIVKRLKGKQSEIRLFLFIIWLAACPFLGQANCGIKGTVEQGRLVFEVLEEGLDLPMLLVRHGSSQLQVVWSRQGDFIELRTTWINSLAGVRIPMYGNTRIRSNILGRYAIIRERSSKDSFFIDVTDLFLKAEIPWPFSSKETVIPSLSYIKGVRYFDNETIIETTRTQAYKENRTSLDMTFSLYRLPKPMQPRLFDHRMAYSYENRYNSQESMPLTAKGSIMRWRLEKRDQGAETSVPVEPIVFYLDPKIPEKWKPYVRAGVYEWLPAFERAGFSNAIEVRDVPKGDKDFSRTSLNRSMIRWKVLEDVRGSEVGGSTIWAVTDYRSGEIIKADILLGMDINDKSDEYFVRCAPLDKRAQAYPFPDDLLGSLIQSTTAHEAGHAFGIRDANFGEFAYPLERVRDIEWLKTMGHTPSIMNYSRHHHIVQPGDSVPPSLLLQRVGPLDRYYIQWGYQPFPQADGPEEELPFLEPLVRQQDSLPWYRYNSRLFEFLGPGSAEEVSDNDDPIGSTLLGLKNLERVMGLIPSANQDKRDDQLVKRLHRKTLDFWYKQMRRVLSMIGGYAIQNRSGAQKGAIYSAIPMVDQKKALAFLLDHAFEVPKWLAEPDFQKKYGYSTNADYLLNRQHTLLEEFMDALRMKRLEYTEESILGEAVVQPLLSDLRAGLFRELDIRSPIVDRRRQCLQGAYLSLLVEGVSQGNYYSKQGMGNTNMIYSDYSKSVMFSELMALRVSLHDAYDRTSDTNTLGHIRMCLLELEKMGLP
ncbi:zinc-dependent metalloprotease [Muricauda sp. CAU 1633]|uniref:zinc-dependent metalloprotease n=1 Tax=Allomuricauda sp. CAU 1633 TaxID=2816036 RepID=UPI001A8C091D|nr:zinc-dependent metalloprotease [Muricauda sp. CAU 1633]MBO0322165.1 zinc-dependent metalloprotease [Muricauda sp. CAU 1633]